MNFPNKIKSSLKTGHYIKKSSKLTRGLDEIFFFLIYLMLISAPSKNQTVLNKFSYNFDLCYPMLKIVFAIVKKCLLKFYIIYGFFMLGKCSMI